MNTNLNMVERKLELIQWLTSLEDLSVVDKIFEIKKKESDWWNEISEAEKNSIEVGLKDVEEGNTICHDDFLMAYRR